VTDTVGFMDPIAVDRLDSRLRAYEEQTGIQLLVWIGRTTGDVPIEDWANRAFEQWGVGKKGEDKGLVLFVMSADRQLRIEVGYGLEVQIPDLRAKRIIDDIIVPGIQGGDPSGAITAGMEAVGSALDVPLPGQAGSSRDRRPPRPSGDVRFTDLIFYGIVGVVLLIIFATNPSLATWMLISFLSGGGGRRRGGFGGGGGWGGGGGFRGGGGLSGGGGASGRW
jgi:uncharacterized protein